MTSTRLVLYLLVAGLISAGLYRLASLPAAAVFAGVATLPLLPVVALRFLASIFILIATIAFVSDLTPLLSGTGSLAFTSFADHWNSIAPASFASMKSHFTGTSEAWLWDGPIMTVFSWPTFALFGLVAIGCGYAGRRRHEVQIYVN